MDSFSIGVWQIIILGFFGVLSPAVVTLIGAVVARQQARETWARQDKAAADLREQNNGIKAQLDTVHTLVNSAMTAAKQSEYDALVRDLASMLEVVDLRKKSSSGEPSSKEILDAIETARNKIAVLRIELDDRQRQAKLIDATEAARLAKVMQQTQGPS